MTFKAPPPAPEVVGDVSADPPDAQAARVKTDKTGMARARRMRGFMTLILSQLRISVNFNTRCTVQGRRPIFQSGSFRDLQMRIFRIS